MSSLGRCEPWHSWSRLPDSSSHSSTAAVLEHGPSAALAGAAALLFLIDAITDSQIVSAAVAGVFATLGAMLAGGAIALAATPVSESLADLGYRPWGFESMAAAAGAMVFCTASLALRQRYRPQASAFAVACAVVGSVACEFAAGDARYAAVALAFAAGAWVASAFVTEWYWLTGIGGALLLGSVAAVARRV